MHPVLCPRCGIGVSYFRRERVGPYCGECGWNLDWVSTISRRPNWFFLKALLACGLLIPTQTLTHEISWRGAVLEFGVLSIIAAFLYLGLTKQRKRAENLVNRIAQKQGADLSSNSPNDPPERVLACEESLRANPPKVRFYFPNRTVVLLARILPLILVYLAARPLFYTGYRLDGFRGPMLYLIQALLALGLWLFFSMVVKQRQLPVQLLKGGISMAKIMPVPGRSSRGVAFFEFLDASGHQVRTERPSNMSLLYQGTYVPVFYDPENPASCIAACDLNYEAADGTVSSTVNPRNRS
jgi:hypothetical protein